MKTNVLCHEQENQPRPLSSKKHSNQNFEDNRPEFLLQRKIINNMSNSTIQRAFSLAEDATSLEKSVYALAQASEPGCQGLNAGDGNFKAISGDQWSTQTREAGKYGIKVKEADAVKLSSWDRVSELVDKNKYIVLIAHEMTHLMHFFNTPANFSYMGERQEWGIEGFPDPEEQLTVSGTATVSKEIWKTITAERQKKYDDSQKIIAGYDKSIAATTSPSQKRVFKKNQKEQVALRDKIIIAENPEGGVDRGGYYEITNPHHENEARAALGYKLRETYDYDKFEPK